MTKDTIKAPTSTSELRNVLLRQMEKVLNGSADSIQTKALCNLAQQVHNTLTLELRAAVVHQRLSAPILAVDFESKRLK